MNNLNCEIIRVERIRFLSFCYVAHSCKSERKITTSTTTTITTTTTLLKTTTTTSTTTPTTTTPRPTKVYEVKVIGKKTYTEAATQCVQDKGELWSLSLQDMTALNASDTLNQESLQKTWTNYRLVVSPWIVQRGLETFVVWVNSELLFSSFCRSFFLSLSVYKNFI